MPTSAEEELALAQEQIRKLVAAIKQDRAERQKEINELINERDEEAARSSFMIIFYIRLAFNSLYYSLI